MDGLLAVVMNYGTSAASLGLLVFAAVTMLRPPGQAPPRGQECLRKQVRVTQAFEGDPAHAMGIEVTRDRGTGVLTEIGDEISFVDRLGAFERLGESDEETFVYALIEWWPDDGEWSVYQAQCRFIEDEEEEE